MDDKTDIELLEMYKKGDVGALGLIIEKYKGPLYAYILSIVKAEAAAEDIFQEVFLKIVKNPHSYKEQGNFKSWLFTVTRNKCMDYFRGAGNDISLDQETEDEMTLHDIIQSDEKDPLDILLNTEDGTAINEVLSMLPQEQREVIILRTTMSFKEIAAALNCPIGTVLARASRGYKKMQSELTNKFAVEEAYNAG
ncbi:RNA polymerase sigma-70 factor (ECF subfamily) [Elusimicrobium simillimum]|uniref:RNA polymerase sigma factor n=1 Tax=Elusimicrobium simillimum TaxID=3143438 RepID=UPI003C6FA7A1